MKKKEYFNYYEIGPNWTQNQCEQQDLSEQRRPLESFEDQVHFPPPLLVSGAGVAHTDLRDRRSGWSGVATLYQTEEKAEKTSVQREEE